jgi:hypothetical protein
MIKMNKVFFDEAENPVEGLRRPKRCSFAAGLIYGRPVQISEYVFWRKLWYLLV